MVATPGIISFLKDAAIDAFVLVGVIVLTAIPFWLANTWGAFLLLAILPLFAILMAASSIDSYWFFADSWMFRGMFLGNMASYQIFIGGAAPLLPALSTYASKNQALRKFVSTRFSAHRKGQ